jgi:hypothetical protein
MEDKNAKVNLTFYQWATSFLAHNFEMILNGISEDLPVRDIFIEFKNLISANFFEFYADTPEQHSLMNDKNHSEYYAIAVRLHCELLLQELDIEKHFDATGKIDILQRAIKSYLEIYYPEEGSQVLSVLNQVDQQEELQDRFKKIQWKGTYKQLASLFVALEESDLILVQPKPVTVCSVFEIQNKAGSFVKLKDRNYITESSEANKNMLDEPDQQMDKIVSSIK